MSAPSYEKVASCEVANVPIAKYKSKKTGLVVCLARVEGPLVNGYFCLGKCCDDHYLMKIYPWCVYVCVCL